jgi:type II secretory pathway pseudopilin PulG
VRGFLTLQLLIVLSVMAILFSSLTVYIHSVNQDWVRLNQQLDSFFSIQNAVQQFISQDSNFEYQPDFQLHTVHFDGFGTLFLDCLVFREN